MKRMNRERLQGFEKVAVPMAEALHSHHTADRAVHRIIGGFNAAFIQAATSRLWQLHGFESIRNLKAPRGAIIVTNHRSYFDMFLFNTPIQRHTELYNRICFPVRSDFFYTSAFGLALNLVSSGGAMWPPVFRDKHRSSLNRTAWAQLQSLLSEGAAVGIHPEGTRNLSADPYTFLPRRAGLGHLIAACSPDTLIVPGFIVGVENDWRSLVARGLRRSGRGGEAIRMWYGSPIRCGDLQSLRLDASAVTELVFNSVRDLADKDRMLTIKHDGDSAAKKRPQ